ncbi:MAG: glycosyltransferase family 4 protein [Pseudomonadota bacterium]|nr:glycosyltransferase family 4 protein [Pseudomonadota bacterium]
MTLRLHLLPEHDVYGNLHGVGHVRLLLPFSHPALSGRVEVTAGTELAGNLTADAIVVQRFWRPDIDEDKAWELVRRVRSAGSRLVYEIDDNLLDLHAGEPWHGTPTWKQRAAVNLFVREADLVLVSTDPLARRLALLNRNVRVLPNALDERLFPPGQDAAQDRDPDRLIIGYMGTLTHLQDLMLVAEPLRALLREQGGRVVLEIVGISSDPRIRTLFQGLPVRFVDPGDNVAYPRFFGWASQTLSWDLGIAPLEGRGFSEFKSDIKFLDYALLGIPGVYSTSTAYGNSVEDGETGLLCDNEPESWYRCLGDILDDPEQRAQLARRAADHVRESRSLRVCAHRWLDALTR